MHLSDLGLISVLVVSWDLCTVGLIVKRNFSHSEVLTPCFLGMNTLIGYDLVPEPKIIEAALRACRRLNDLASAVRILEAVKVS